MQNESAPGARGPVFCGVDTHADSHWLCVLDWRGRKVLSRQFPADAAGYEALAGAIAAAGEPACVAMEGTSSYGAASPAPRVAGDARARGALPGGDAEVPGAGKVRRGGRGEGRPRGDVRLQARDPQEPGRVGRRGALHARGALRGGEGADLGGQHREVAAHHRPGGAQVEVPRDGGAEADGGAPLRARRGRAGRRARRAGGPVVGGGARRGARHGARDRGVPGGELPRAAGDVRVRARQRGKARGRGRGQPGQAALRGVVRGDMRGLPHPRLERQDREAQAQQGRRPAGEQRAARDREAEGHARPRDRRVRREGEGAGEERQGGHEVPQALRGQGGVPGADAPARGQEARGRLRARGGQARGEGQPGEGGVHTGNQREVHLDAGEGPKGAQAHKEGLRGMGRGRTSARLGQAGLRGRAQNGF